MKIRQITLSLYSLYSFYSSYFQEVKGDDDNEVYDPESAFADFSEPPSPAKKAKKEEPTFSDSESPSPPPPKKGLQKPEKSGKPQEITEKVAGLEKQLEELKKQTSTMSTADKKEAETAEPSSGFKGLPNSISSILFGGSGSAAAKPAEVSRDPRKKPPAVIEKAKKQASVLGKMSDADLLAKAAAEIGAPPVSKPKIDTSAPPPKFVPINSSIPPPAPPTIRTGNSKPAASSDSSTSGGSNTGNSISGPWMQGYEPKQPNLPWPANDSDQRSGSSSYRIDRGAGSDRGSDRGGDRHRGHSNTKRDYRRDYDDRRDRDRDRDRRDHHRRDQHRGGQYRDRSRDRDRRDRSRDRSYERDRRDRDLRDDRSRDRYEHHDRDDRGRDRYQRHDRDYDRDDRRPSQDNTEKYKPINDTKNTNSKPEESKKDFLSIFNSGEPKPPGEDVIPF